MPCDYVHSTPVERGRLPLVINSLRCWALTALKSRSDVAARAESRLRLVTMYFLEHVA